MKPNVRHRIEPTATDEWKTEPQKSSVDVKIQAYEKRFERLSCGRGYTCYEVVLSYRGGHTRQSVWRRYREFLNLHKYLSRDNANYSYSAFPPKTIFGRFTEGIIETRRHALTAFSKAVLSLPQAETISVVREFFQLPPEPPAVRASDFSSVGFEGDEDEQSSLSSLVDHASACSLIDNGSVTSLVDNGLPSDQPSAVSDILEHMFQGYEHAPSTVFDSVDSDEDNDDLIGITTFDYDSVEPKYGVGVVHLSMTEKERDVYNSASDATKCVKFPAVVHYWNAIANNDLEGVAHFLEETEFSDIETSNGLGFTGLIRAALSGFHEIVEFLIAAGADVNATNFERSTALHYAVVENDYRLAYTLLKHKARIDIEDFEGKSALDLCEDDSMRELLQEENANNMNISSTNSNSDSEFSD
eukprot:CFRG2953T1